MEEYRTARSDSPKKPWVDCQSVEQHHARLTECFAHDEKTGSKAAGKIQQQEQRLRMRWSEHSSRNPYMSLSDIINESANQMNSWPSYEDIKEMNKTKMFQVSDRRGSTVKIEIPHKGKGKGSTTKKDGNYKGKKKGAPTHHEWIDFNKPHPPKMWRCLEWMESKSCAYGNDCKYAHGNREVKAARRGHRN